MNELRQRLDRALFVEQNELELLLHHVLELGKRQLPVRLSRVAYDLQHAEAALVSGAVGPADVDQCAERALVRAAGLKAMLERVSELGCGALALEIALDVTRDRIRFGHQADHGLDKRRPIGIQEHRFRHRVAGLAQRFQTGRDPV